MNIPLKTAIFASGKSQRRIAFEAGMNVDRLSKFVCGWLSPRPHEIDALCRVLQCSPEIFAKTTQQTQPLEAA